MSSADVALRHVRQFMREHEVVILSLGLTGLGVYLFRKWLRGGRCKCEAMLRGKTVVITGAGSGIGKETARDLVRRGARVVMVCTNLDQVTKAANEIIDQFPKGHVTIKSGDLSSLQSVHALAQGLLESEPRIDMLINNAGMLCSKKLTGDGFETMLATNYLGHFLLTNLLLDKLKKSAPSRIVIVSSHSHKLVSSINWEDLNYDLPKSFSPLRVYGHSNLANILFAKELARRLLGTGVTTYAVHPGFVKTDFLCHIYEHLGILARTGLMLLYPFAKTAEQGAQTTIHCAVDDNIQNRSGYYYSDCRECSPSIAACDDEAARRLWDVSVKLVGLKSDLHPPFRSKKSQTTCRK